MRNYLKKASTTLMLGFIVFIGMMAFKGKNKENLSVQTVAKSNEAGDGVAMTYQEFTAAKSAWKTINPGLNATYGGSISKDAIMQVINTLPADNQRVVFYFGTDATGKTYVMFAPPGANTASKIYRNDSYCPSVCN